jgi:hypothetical protein
VFFDVENPMEVGETAPTGPPATGRPPETRSRLSLPDRLRGRRDETRPESNPRTGRREQPSKGCCGTHPHDSLWGHGPTHPPSGDRRREPSQEGPRASARGNLHRTRALRRMVSGGQQRMREDLEGEKAHGRHERPIAGNGGEVATDSSAEQGLEVGRSPGGQLTARTWKRVLRKVAENSGAREETEAGASAPAHRASRSLALLVDVGVRFGGSEHPTDPGQGPPAPGPPRWDGASLGLGCWTAARSALSGSGRSPSCMLRQAAHTGPDVPTASAASEHRPTRVPRSLLRQEAHTRTEATDLLRQAPSLRRALGPASAGPGSPSLSDRRVLAPPAHGVGFPPPDARFGRRRPPTASAAGGRSMGGHEAPASPVETPPTSVGDATTDQGKRPRRLRPTRVLHRPRPAGKVPPRIPAASVAGRDGPGGRTVTARRQRTAVMRHGC